MSAGPAPGRLVLAHRASGRGGLLGVAHALRRTRHRGRQTPHVCARGPSRALNVAKVNVSGRPTMSHARRRFVAAGAAVLTGLAGLTVASPPAQGSGAADAPYNVKTPTSKGYGGAVTSVDPEASKIGLEVLKRGGNAVDAAVATAAALGVTEPYSSGIGGGGYFVHYDARTGKVGTIDGRETAPRTMPHDAFIDPKTGKPYNFTPGAGHQRRLGRYAGIAGHLGHRAEALGDHAASARRCGRRPDSPTGASRSTRRSTCRPSENQRRFANFPATSKLFLPGGTAARGRVDPAQPRPRGDVPADREEGRPGVLRRSARQGDRAHRAAPAEARQPRPADPARLPARRRPRALPRQAAGADPRRLPRARRLRDGAVLLRRHHRRRGAEHPRALPPARHVRRRRAAPLPRGERAGLRRPREVRRRPGVRRGPAEDPALRQVRRRAGLPDQPDEGAHQAGRPGQRDVVRREVRRVHGASRTPSPTPRTSTPPTSPWPTSGATSSSTRSPSSRPVAPGWSCPAAASC